MFQPLQRPRRVLAVLVSAAALAQPAYAQLAMKQAPRPEVAVDAMAASCELSGIVRDERGRPVQGAVVSAVGATAAFAVSDREGRFSFRNVSPGAYLLRAHLQGFQPARGHMVRLTRGSRTSESITISRRADAEPAPRVLAAGIGPVDTPDPAAADDEDEAGPETTHDHDEIAWRLRHAKRSVLKDADSALAGLGDEESIIEDSLAGLSRAVGSPARLASALFSDVSFNGEINLLTTTSFHRPQDLFQTGADAPQSVAYVALAAPTSTGEWQVRGTMTQGDLASWMLAGSYQSREIGSHAIDAGLSYGMQRYLGGNAEALAALRDGSRNVGTMYASDVWALSPQVQVGYGAQFGRYDYLTDQNLFSPQVSVTIRPSASDTLKLHASVRRRESAPGEQEFLPASTGLWLPPQRTFSGVSRDGFAPQRMDHVEIGGERQWAGEIVLGVRAFRQRVGDQVVTLFGMASADSPAPVGHYYVGSGGTFDARGWGVTVSRSLGDAVRASIDYMQVHAARVGMSPDAAALLPLAASLLRAEERFHDVTATIDGALERTDTRFFVLYKINSAFASADADGLPGIGGRFDVQVSQPLPFMKVSGTRWEMLIAVRNLFRSDLADASVYDELLVVRPPKRVMGGVTVRF